MSKHVISNLRKFEQHTRAHTSEAVFRQVMAGSEKITNSTPLETIALWMQGAVERLEALVEEPVCQQIMLERGTDCAGLIQNVIQQEQNQRKVCASLEEFLDAKVQNPPRGSKLFRDGNKLYQSFTPGDFYLHCYCPLLRKLPLGRTVSTTYCQCSTAFVQYFWENVLERPLRVELLSSCLAGDKECQFEIDLDNH